MLIRKVHLIAQEFKQPRGAYKNAGRRITPLTRLSIDANMGCFVNLEAYQFQTFLYRLHFINSLTWSLAIFLLKRTMLVRPASHHVAGCAMVPCHAAYRTSPAQSYAGACHLIERHFLLP